VFEVLHCTTRFPEAVRAIVDLFLDEDVDDVAVAQRAKQMLYQLLCECEDSYQFLEVYWAVIEFVGDKLSAGDLFLSKYTALKATDPVSVRAVDTIRVLLLLLERIPFHWIHFSAEVLAKVFLSTFHVLNMYSKLDAEVDVAFIRPLSVMACLEEYPRWLQVWLLKAPSRCQLFLALDEIGLVADALQQLSSLQPLVEPSGGRFNVIEKRLTAYVSFPALISSGWALLLRTNVPTSAARGGGACERVRSRTRTCPALEVPLSARAASVESIDLQELQTSRSSVN